MLPDSLHIAQLSVRVPLGVDAWGRTLQQPVNFDIQIHTDVSQAGRSDHLPYSIHYGILVKEVEKHCQQVEYSSLDHLANGIAKVCIFICKAPKVTLSVQKPRALLHAKFAAIEVIRTPEDFVHETGRSASLEDNDITALTLSSTAPSTAEDKLVVRDLCISAILGVNPWERLEKQLLKINMTIRQGLLPSQSRPQDYRTITKTISDYVETTDFQTVESLALSIAKVAVVHTGVESIRVRVEKPSAIMYAHSAGCEVQRDRSFFDSELSQQSSIKPLAASEWHMVAIALGSNMGDRAGNIERAVQALEQHASCRLVDTSFLYETAPMYYKDQPKFLNGACRIATALSPEELLDLTQSIEKQVGRDKRGVPINGPRVIDLDILFYDDLQVSTPRLTVPHASLKDREFVLRPLADILPDLEHPMIRRSVKEMLGVLINAPDYEIQHIERVMPIASTSDLYWSWGSKTYVMGIINATPDSFSDAGDNYDVAAAVRTAQGMVVEGADILDVGGMSTAPNAPEITAQQETERVVPVIRAIRANPGTAAVPISIDTFHASVARAALEAGANIINDVTGGSRDPAILEVSRELAAPIVLMHMRGDSKTMNGMAKYEDGVVATVAHELEQRFSAALMSRVRRWNVILDPGIGFAKDQAGNLALLRGLASITKSNVRGVVPQEAVAAEQESRSSQEHTPNSSLSSLPLLVGPSRKRFIGSVTGRTEPKDRVAGTGAACAAAISQGCDVIRVHDVKEMVDTARISDAIFRSALSGRETSAK